jgi:hypothetical protein
MAESRNPDLSVRIAELERDLRELRARVIALERMVGSGEEHPSDQTTVRRKVAYDWQA